MSSARAAADAQLFGMINVGELTGQAAIKYDEYLRAVERVYRKETRLIRINNFLENPEVPAKRKARAIKRLARVQANLQKNIMHIDGLKALILDNGGAPEERNLDCPDAGLSQGESIASVFYPEEVEFYQSCSEKGTEVTLSCINGVVEGDRGDLVDEISECQVKEVPYVATELAVFGPGAIVPQSSDTTLTDFASSANTDDIRWKNGECRYLKFNYPFRLYSYTDFLDGAPLNPEDATSVGEEACEYLITLLP